MGLMIWEARRSDDDSTARAFNSDREARDWVNSRTMPWEFYVCSLDVPNNVEDSIEISRRLADIATARAELKRTFAQRELDGGVAAVVNHPLWPQLQAEEQQLRERLIQLV